jgi:Arc/MetJ family transcription regulator
MAKIEIDQALLARLSEIAASSLSNTTNHKALKDEVKASGNDIHAAAYIFQRLSDGSNAKLPESIAEFNEFSIAMSEIKSLQRIKAK